jgi:hypothetical protein
MKSGARLDGPFEIGGSMKRPDASRVVHGLAERRRGRSKATDTARSTGLWFTNRRDGQPPKGRSSAPDDDAPQIASASGLLDPRPIILQSLQIDLARSLTRLLDKNPDPTTRSHLSL